MSVCAKFQLSSWFRSGLKVPWGGVWVGVVVEAHFSPAEQKECWKSTNVITIQMTDCNAYRSCQNIYQSKKVHDLLGKPWKKKNFGHCLKSVCGRGSKVKRNFLPKWGAKHDGLEGLRGLAWNRFFVLPYLSQIMVKINDLGHFLTAKMRDFYKIIKILSFEKYLNGL